MLQLVNQKWNHPVQLQYMHPLCFVLALSKVLGSAHAFFCLGIFYCSVLDKHKISRLKIEVLDIPEVFLLKSGCSLNMRCIYLCLEVCQLHVPLLQGDSSACYEICRSKRHFWWRQEIICLNDVNRQYRMDACSSKIWWASHVLLDCHLLHPKYWVCYRRPLGLITVTCLKDCLFNFKVGMLY